eukprot:10163616-Alexandrium_andersonii.AAC.1
MGGRAAVLGHMAWTVGRRTLEAYGLVVEAAASNLEEAAIAILCILPMTATASSTAYQEILGWGLVLAKAAAYTWGLGLSLAALGSVFRCGLSGP